MSEDARGGQNRILYDSQIPSLIPITISAYDMPQSWKTQARESDVENYDSAGQYAYCPCCNKVVDVGFFTSSYNGTDRELTCPEPGCRAETDGVPAFAKKGSQTLQVHRNGTMFAGDFPVRTTVQATVNTALAPEAAYGGTYKAGTYMTSKETKKICSLTIESSYDKGADKVTMVPRAEYKTITRSIDPQRKDVQMVTGVQTSTELETVDGEVRERFVDSPMMVEKGVSRIKADAMNVPSIFASDTQRLAHMPTDDHSAQGLSEQQVMLQALDRMDGKSVQRAARSLTRIKGGVSHMNLEHPYLVSIHDAFDMQGKVSPIIDNLRRQDYQTEKTATAALYMAHEGTFQAMFAPDDIVIDMDGVQWKCAGTNFVDSLVNGAMWSNQGGSKLPSREQQILLRSFYETGNRERGQLNYPIRERDDAEKSMHSMRNGANYRERDVALDSDQWLSLAHRRFNFSEKMAHGKLSYTRASDGQKVAVHDWMGYSVGTEIYGEMMTYYPQILALALSSARNNVYNRVSAMAREAAENGQSFGDFLAEKKKSDPFWDASLLREECQAQIIRAWDVICKTPDKTLMTLRSCHSIEEVQDACIALASGCKVTKTPEELRQMDSFESRLMAAHKGVVTASTSLLDENLSDADKKKFETIVAKQNEQLTRTVREIDAATLFAQIKVLGLPGAEVNEIRGRITAALKSSNGKAKPGAEMYEDVSKALSEKYGIESVLYEDTDKIIDKARAIVASTTTVERVDGMNGKITAPLCGWLTPSEQTSGKSKNQVMMDDTTKTWFAPNSATLKIIRNDPLSAVYYMWLGQGLKRTFGYSDVKHVGDAEFMIDATQASTAVNDFFGKMFSKDGDGKIGYDRIVDECVVKAMKDGLTDIQGGGYTALKDIGGISCSSLVIKNGGTPEPLPKENEDDEQRYLISMKGCLGALGKEIHSSAYVLNELGKREDSVRNIDSFDPFRHNIGSASAEVFGATGESQGDPYILSQKKAVRPDICDASVVFAQLQEKTPAELAHALYGGEVSRRLTDLAVNILADREEAPTPEKIADIVAQKGSAVLTDELGTFLNHLSPQIISGRMNLHPREVAAMYKVIQKDCPADTPARFDYVGVASPYTMMTAYSVPLCSLIRMDALPLDRGDIGKQFEICTKFSKSPELYDVVTLLSTRNVAPENILRGLAMIYGEEAPEILDRAMTQLDTYIVNKDAIEGKGAALKDEDVKVCLSLSELAKADGVDGKLSKEDQKAFARMQKNIIKVVGTNDEKSIMEGSASDILSRVAYVANNYMATAAIDASSDEADFTKIYPTYTFDMLQYEIKGTPEERRMPGWKDTFVGYKFAMHKSMYDVATTSNALNNCASTAHIDYVKSGTDILCYLIDPSGERVGCAEFRTPDSATATVRWSSHEHMRGFNNNALRTRDAEAYNFIASIKHLPEYTDSHSDAAQHRDAAENGLSYARYYISPRTGKAYDGKERSEGRNINGGWSASAVRAVNEEELIKLRQVHMDKDIEDPVMLAKLGALKDATTFAMPPEVQLLK